MLDISGLAAVNSQPNLLDSGGSHVFQPDRGPPAALPPHLRVDSPTIAEACKVGSKPIMILSNNDVHLKSMTRHLLACNTLAT